MKIVTRKEAKALGLKKYYTGMFCSRGHIAERKTNNGNCVICLNERSKEHYIKNNGKEKQKTESRRKTKREWRKKNKGRVNSWTARRYAAKKQRTPTWLTQDDFWLMEEAYTLAVLREKTTKIKWSVDHIVPMQGDTVSGLHVPNNLRVIPLLANSEKSNKWNWELQQ
jgi:hypothetical protein